MLRFASANLALPQPPLNIVLGGKGMNINTAKKLMDVLAHMSTPINRLWATLQAAEEPADREHLKERFTALMFAYMEIQDDVVDEYPQFDPTGEGEELWYSLKKKYETPEYPVRKLTEEEKRGAEGAGDAAASEIENEKNDF